MSSVRGKRLWVVFFAALLLGGSLGFGGGFRVGWVEALTANGTWSGSWLTEVWGNFTSGLYVEDLTAGRPIISGLGGRLATDAGLLWDAATNTLTVSNRTNTGQISISGLTPGRIPYVTTGNLLADAAGLLYNTITGTFTAPNIVTPGDANATDVHASNLYANTAQIRDLYAERMWDKIVTVATTGGNYTSLASALTAITDADATNRYCILVIGKITETAAITAKSYVDVFGMGSDITVSSDLTLNALDVGAITNSVWTNIILRRSGNPPGYSYVINVSNGDSTVIFRDCQFISEINASKNLGVGINLTGGTVRFERCLGQGAGGKFGYGVSIINSGSDFDSCRGIGGNGGTDCSGWYITNGATGKFNNCIGNGGTGGSSCYGWFTTGAITAVFSSCRGVGGTGGSGSYGWYVYGASMSKYVNCEAYGGTSTVSNHGWVVSSASSAIFESCLGVGGTGTTSCSGWDIGGGSSPTLKSCTGIGGSGGVDCYGFNINGNGSPYLQDCSGSLNKYSATFSYDDANNGRFRPYASKPYQFISAYVSVASATGGAHLDIGTSIGGSEIASGIDIASTGSKYFNFIQPEVAADGYLYATPSAAAADASFTIYYVVCSNYATCYAIYLDSQGKPRITGQYISNGASNTIYITDLAESANGWIISNSYIETTDPTNQKSVECQSAYVGVPIYKSIFIGPFTNVSGLANENSGTQATTIAVAATMVTHNLGYTPVAGDIMLTPTTSTFNCTSYAITAYSSTTFTITTYDAAGAAKGSSSAITFAWRATKYP